MKDPAGPYLPTRAYWWAVRAGFTGLLLGLLLIRSLFPSYPVDSVTIGILVLLIFVWVLPYLTEFALPGGIRGKVVGVRPTVEIPTPGEPVGPPTPGAEKGIGAAIRSRIREARRPEERSFYSTLIETAVFLKLEKENPPPDFEVQRYPMIIVNGEPTGIQFHAIMRSRLWPGRRFYYIENAVGDIQESKIYKVLEELRRRADFTNRVLQLAPNEYILVAVSDFEEDLAKRDRLNRLINQAENAIAVPTFSSLTWDLSDLPNLGAAVEH